jgi:5-oxoprolinase (ATP-hydrolysing)
LKNERTFSAIFSTILVELNCRAAVSHCVDIRIDIEQRKDLINSTELDLVRLSIFQHRFTSIAKQFGRSVKRMAISTNIKERLDFSCAVFGQDGSLIANAPHIPVHLGEMQETVSYQVINGPRPNRLCLTRDSS